MENEQKTALERRYEIEARCLGYLREFVEKCKEEGLTFGEDGYLGVSISSNYFAITNAEPDAPPEKQTNAWWRPQDRDTPHITHLTRYGDMSLPEVAFT